MVKSKRFRLDLTIPFCLTLHKRMGNVRDPLIQSNWGKSENGRPRNIWRKHASLILGASTLCLLFVIALITSGMKTSTRRSVSLAQFIGDQVNVQYLQAEASGKGGKDFMKRLQDIWFVAQYRFDPTVEFSRAKNYSSL